MFLYEFDLGILLRFLAFILPRCFFAAFDHYKVSHPFFFYVTGKQYHKKKNFCPLLNGRRRLIGDHLKFYGWERSGIK